MGNLVNLSGLSGPSLPEPTKKLNFSCADTDTIIKDVIFEISVNENGTLDFTPNEIFFKDLLESTTVKHDREHFYVIKELLVVDYYNRSNLTFDLLFNLLYFEDGVKEEKRFTIYPGEHQKITSPFIIQYPFDRDGVVELYAPIKDDLLKYNPHTTESKSASTVVCLLKPDSVFYAYYFLFYEDLKSELQKESTKLDGTLRIHPSTKTLVPFIQMRHDSFVVLKKYLQTKFYSRIKSFDALNSSIKIDVTTKYEQGHLDNFKDILTEKYEKKNQKSCKAQVVNVSCKFQIQIVRYTGSKDKSISEDQELSYRFEHLKPSMICVKAEQLHLTPQ